MSRGRRRKQDPSIGVITLVAIAIGIAIVNHSSFTSTQAALIIILIVIGCTSALVGLGILYAIKNRKRQALRAVDLAAVSTMTGIEFEKYVAELLQFQGYRIRMTPTSGDYGVDIVAHRNGLSTAVQVKRYKDSLGVAAVQQGVAGMRHYKCTRSMVVTNSRFTANAKALAVSNQCELVDGVVLGEWIIAYRTAVNTKR